MTKPDIDTILAALAKATSQQPVDERSLAKACGLTMARLKAGLQTLLDDRRVCTCHVIKGDIDHHVYWPTDIVTPALSAPRSRPARQIPISHPQPAAPATTTTKEPLMKPAKTETNTARLVQTVQQHGPLCAHDLADRTCVPVKNVDGSLAIAQRNGTIVTRKGYVAERGKDLKLYMTPPQAAAWDEAQASQAGQGESAGSRAVAPAAKDIPDFLLMQPDAEALAIIRSALGVVDATATLDDLAKRLRAVLHELRGEIAAHRMLLEAVCQMVGARDAEGVLDALRGRLTAVDQGRPCLLLVDEQDHADILEVQGDVDPRRQAFELVESGQITTAIVANILGRYTMPKPEPFWMDS